MSFKRVPKTRKTPVLDWATLLTSSASVTSTTSNTNVTPRASSPKSNSRQALEARAAPVRRDDVWDFDFSDASQAENDQKDSDFDIIPPTQVIDCDDDEESSAETAFVMGTPEPSIKRLRLGTTSNSEISSRKTFENPSAWAERKPIETEQRSFDVFGAEEDENIEVDFSSDSQTSNDNSPKRPTGGLTGNQWVKKNLGNVDQKGANLSEDMMDILSASSASQSSGEFDRSVYNSVNVFETDRRRPERRTSGLGRELEMVLRKRESDRLLRQYIAGPAVEKPVRKGRIISLLKVSKSLLYVRCRNLQMAPESKNTFKFLYRMPKRTVNLPTGSDVIIHGPWTSHTSSSGEELLTNFDRFEVFENCAGKDRFSTEILLRTDCDCHDENI